MVIAVVALLVIGPEKLPKVARTVGAFTGRMQRYMAQIKEEVNREMRFEELQKLQQEIKQSVENTKSGINQQIADISDTVIKPKKPVKLKTAAKPKPVVQVKSTQKSALKSVQLQTKPITSAKSTQAKRVKKSVNQLTTEQLTNEKSISEIE